MPLILPYFGAGKHGRFWSRVLQQRLERGQTRRRELAGRRAEADAQRGGATTVWISGKNRERAISLVVRDNGRGFDTRRRPGPQDGHFGIEGIRERVRRLDGAFEIESAPDRGTVARVMLSLDGEKR